MLACPDILEDADGEDERPAVISIGDEQIDEHPFDPSLPDEIHYRMMLQQAAQASEQISSTSASLPERVSRLFAARPPPAAIASPPAESPRTSGSWFAKLRPRRDSHDLEEVSPADALARERGVRVQEPGAVVSCTKGPSKSLHLVPLDQAQKREDIIRRPEGFELAERKDSLIRVSQ